MSFVANASKPETFATTSASGPCSPLAYIVMLSMGGDKIRPYRSIIQKRPNASSATSRSNAAKVRSWLLAYKTYPKHARMRRKEGVVRVIFVINRTGRLIEGRVLAACGLAVLDDEAAAMLHRASHYSPAPSDLPGERFGIIAPVDFVMPG